MGQPPQEKKVPDSQEAADALLELFAPTVPQSNAVMVCLVDQVLPLEQKLQGEQDCACK